MMRCVPFLPLQINLAPKHHLETIFLCAIQSGPSLRINIKLFFFCLIYSTFFYHCKKCRAFRHGLKTSWEHSGWTSQLICCKITIYNLIEILGYWWGEIIAVANVNNISARRSLDNCHLLSAAVNHKNANDFLSRCGRKIKAINISGKVKPPDKHRLIKRKWFGKLVELRVKLTP